MVPGRSSRFRSLELSSIRRSLEPVCSFFDIGEVENLVVLGGVANDNYAVRTPKGQYVLKFFKEHDPDSLKTIDPLLRKLRRYDFPATYYLRNQSGDFVYNHGDTVAVAMQKAQGDTPVVEAQSAFVMGETLARLHCVPVDGLSARQTWFSPEFLPRGLEELVPRLPPETIERIRKAWNALSDIDDPGHHRSMIHGDYHPGNLLFREGRLTTVLDWEEISIGPALLDIAYAALIVFFDDSGFDADLFARFVEGYQSVRVLDISERNSLGTFVRFAGLTVAVWLMLRHDPDSDSPELDDLSTRYWTAGLEDWELPRSFC